VIISYSLHRRGFYL